MLIVNFHSLRPVNSLNFVKKILLHSLDTTDTQNVVRHERSANQSIPRTHYVASVDEQWLTRWNDVLNFVSVFPLHNDNSFATFAFLRQLNLTINLSHDGWIFRLASFKQLRNSRQTTSNVLRTRRFTRCLRDDRTSIDDIAVADFKTCTFRKVVEVQNLSG